MSTAAHQPPSGVARESTGPQERTTPDGPRAAEAGVRQPAALLADVHHVEHLLASLQQTCRNPAASNRYIRDQFRSTCVAVAHLAAGLHAHLQAWPDGETGEPERESEL